MLEQINNIYSIVINVIGLMIAMFLYVQNPKRDHECGIVFLLCILLCNYYWGTYVLLMGHDPNVSSFMAYFGWNICYFPLLIMILNRRSEEEKKYFHVLCLFPIPLNVAQFFLYMQFGGLFNNLWEGIFSSLIACISVNSLLFYMKNRKNGAKFPYETVLALLFIGGQYIMWTVSCFDWPDELHDPYTYASFAMATLTVFVPFFVAKELGQTKSLDPINEVQRHINSVIRPLYVGAVLIFSVGGYLFAYWVKQTLSKGMVADSETDPYSIIAVQLFVFSLILVIFSMAIILIVRFGREAAESEELRKAKDIADHSNAAKSDFLANMSHEIRTPINAILGMNEMILREGLSSRDALPKDREVIRKGFADICNYAGNVESAGTNLLSIINDILDFSKIEAGKLEIVEGNYKLSTMLNDLCNMITFKAREKGLQFEIDVDSSLPDGLYGDEVRMRQVVTNILNNAVKYTKKGSVCMSVKGRMAEELKDGKAVILEIRVKDTGIGIREEDIDKLFTKFERMDLKTNSTVEGTGLGLAITKNLLTMMGGSIEVESTYGEGSQFTVILPQKVVSSEKVGDFKSKYEKSIQERKAYEESFRAPDAHLLIVDDTTMNLTVVKGLLKSTQVEIDTATSGPQSIEMAKEKAYDIILMDQRMPEMDGTQAMHVIQNQQDGANRKTPFICLTADAVTGARERYMAEGFADYLTKPIDSGELERMLVKYLPQEKLQPGRTRKDVAEEDGDSEQTASKEDTDSSQGFCKQLEEAGIDTSVGLMHCQKDLDFYKTILTEYVSGAKEKAAKIREYRDSRNWNEYGVLVHSLKSTSKMIGITDLYEIAARLEKAADEADEKTIEEKHSAMMERYDKVTELIGKTIGEVTGEGSKDGGDASDDEVLEFLPQ